ncbi:MAG: hypothetical protein QOH48_538 [Actinomycetota bacterium]|jgi:hypothetical protein|nr:hypothetical protein [Actinomycetota bacterium]
MGNPQVVSSLRLVSRVMSAIPVDLAFEVGVA